MPLHDFACERGHVFEKIVPLSADTDPDCPACGQRTRKIPSAGMLLGRAQTGLAKNQMPQTWKGTYEGNPEYIATLRKDWSARQRLESKYPEIAGDQRPVLAHEGRYHDAPLRQGDTEVGRPSVSDHGHDHGHGHQHGHSHDTAAVPSAPTPTRTGPTSE